MLSSLLEDKLDKFEVLAVARKLSLKLPEKRSFSQQKYILLQLLLLQLIKSDQERTSYYKRLLTETEQNLDVKKGNPYLCCLVGCLFSTEKHRIYLQHLKAVHFRHDQLICNFRKQCVRQFSSLGRLLSHVKESHSVIADLEKEKRQVEDDVECRCDMMSCGGMKFKNTNLLLTHVNNYHITEERSCVFDQCDYRFSRGSR